MDRLLQAHFRTKGGVPEQPILKAFQNIQVMNAVLTWDGYPVPQVVDGKEVARLGHVSTQDGKRFAIRRAA